MDISNLELSHQNELIIEQSNCRKNGLFTDCIIKCQDKDVSAHAVILSSSCPYFSALLKRTKEEGKTGQLEFEHMTSQVLEIILNYLYTGKIEDLKDDIELIKNVIMAANSMELSPLFDYYLEILVGKLKVENVVEIWNLLETYEKKEVHYMKVLKYISDNFSEIICHANCLPLTVSQMQKIIDFVKVSHACSDVVAFIIKWVKQDTERLNDIMPLIKSVDIKKLSKEYLYEILTSEPLFKLQESFPLCEFFSSEAISRLRVSQENAPQEANVQEQKLYFITQNDGTKIQTYSRKDKKWKQPIKFPNTVHIKILPEVFAVDNWFYLIDVMSGQFLAYHCTLDYFEKFPDLPQDAVGYKRIVIQNKNIYVWNETSFYCFSLNTKLWTQLTHISEKCNFCQMYAAKESIVFVAKDKGTIHMYDINSNKWVLKCTKACVQEYKSFAVCKGKVYFRVADSILIDYDLKENKWNVQMKEELRGKSHISVNCEQDNILFLDSNNYKQIWINEPDKDEWHQVLYGQDIKQNVKCTIGFDL